MIGVIAVILGLGIAYIGQHEAKRNADAGRPLTVLLDLGMFLVGAAILFWGFAALVAEGSL